MSSPDYSSKFVLYSSNASIRATMVRLAFAMRRQTVRGRPDMNWHIHTINITAHQPDQLDEHYLCNINPEGKVPVLLNEVLLHKPMSGTIKITWYLCEWYPDLLPPQHEQSIKDLTNELHEIDFSALTFGSQTKLPTEIRNRVEDILRSDETSETYRKALEHKCQSLSQWQNSLMPHAVENAKQLARRYCSKIEQLKGQHKAEYISG